MREALLDDYTRKLAEVIPFGHSVELVSHRTVNKQYSNNLAYVYEIIIFDESFQEVESMVCNTFYDIARFVFEHRDKSKELTFDGLMEMIDDN